MKAEGVGGAYNQEKMDSSVDGHVDHKAEQIGLSLQYGFVQGDK